MEIGKRIKQKREELGLLQEELAQRVGYKSRSSINKIEVDGRGLPQKKIVALAEALETSPAYLMGWIEDSNFDKELAEKQKQQWDAFAKKHNENFYQIQLLTSFNELNDDNKNKAISYTQNLLKMQELENEQKIFLNAAHERTDITFTEEERLADEKMIEEDED